MGLDAERDPRVGARAATPAWCIADETVYDIFVRRWTMERNWSLSVRRASKWPSARQKEVHEGFRKEPSEASFERFLSKQTVRGDLALFFSKWRSFVNLPFLNPN